MPTLSQTVSTSLSRLYVAMFRSTAWESPACTTNAAPSPIHTPMCTADQAPHGAHHAFCFEPKQLQRPQYIRTDDDDNECDGDCDGDDDDDDDRMDGHERIPQQEGAAPKVRPLL